MSQHHDPVVGDALRRLDVPDHGPDFWARLDARLADDAPAGGTASRHRLDDAEQDAPALDLATSPAPQRRLADCRRTPMLALAAAVAIGVALVVGTAVLSPGADESGVDTGTASETDGRGGDPAPSPPVPGDTADTTLPEPTATLPEGPAPMTADQAETDAVEWLDRLLAGDVEGAYGLLDDTSRERMPLEEFEQMGAGLFEGAAAFAQDGIERSVLQVETAAGVVSVVRFSGDVQREGMVETAAYPVVLTATGVHFTLGGPQLEIDTEYLDSSGATLTSPLVMTIGADVPEVWAWAVGGGLDVLDPVEGRGRVEIDVEAKAGPGTHLVTLLAVQGDLIVARTHTVVVP